MRIRKAPKRLDCISSDWIELTENVDYIQERMSETTVNKKSKTKRATAMKKLKAKKDLNKNALLASTMNENMDATTGGGSKTLKNDLKREEAKELLRLIENSYKNIYFTRCKSYRKLKLSDLDFKFDFSTFDSKHPNYPNALEDINSKLTRTNSFWNDIKST